MTAARLADYTSYYETRPMNLSTLAMWQLRSEIAVSLYEVMKSGALKRSRLKRIATYSTVDPSPSDYLIRKFTKLA